MAWVRNNTRTPIPVPNWCLIPPLAQIDCANDDILRPDVWPSLYPMTANGDLSYALDAATEESPVNVPAVSGADMAPPVFLDAPADPPKPIETESPAPEPAPETQPAPAAKKG